MTTGPCGTPAAPCDGWFARNRLPRDVEHQAVRLLLLVGGIGVEIGFGSGRFPGEHGVAPGPEDAAPVRDGRAGGCFVVKRAGKASGAGL